jgi:hypothetical protein
MYFLFDFIMGGLLSSLPPIKFAEVRSMAVACRAVQFWEAALQKKTVSPMSFAPRINHF